MKYYTWKLDWTTREGIDPTFHVNNEYVRLEPHFMIGEVSDQNSSVYGYLIKGSIDLNDLEKWNVIEISAEQMLEYAKSLNSEADLVNEFIVFPEISNIVI